MTIEVDREMEMTNLSEAEHPTRKDAALERWLREDVARSFDEHKADPATAIPAEQIMARLRSRADTRRNEADDE